MHIHRTIPFLILRITSFPRHNLSTDPAFTLTYFYIWTQIALYVSLMTSIIPCLKAFVAGLNTGYGAFDKEHVATKAYGSFASHAYAPRTRHSTYSSHLPSKSGSYFGKEPNSLSSNGIKTQRATAVSRTEPKATGHQEDPSQASLVSKATRLGLDRRVTNEGKGMDHTVVVAQDGNSIGSNDSRQMIIRKEVAWAVEFSGQDE